MIHRLTASYIQEIRVIFIIKKRGDLYATWKNKTYHRRKGSSNSIKFVK